MATIPATSCKGTISTWGYFLTIKIKTANVIGIVNATIFPDIWPGDKELPNIINKPKNEIKNFRSQNGKAKLF